MKIGIMGGTFDPIHYGHLLLAERLREEFEIDKIIFVPTGKSAHKELRKVSPAEKRLEMVKMAISDNSSFTLSDMEINRGGSSYTSDTMRELNTMFEGHSLYFMTGADVLFSIESWHDVDWLFKNVNFLVSTRPGFDNKDELNERLDYLRISRGAKIILKEFKLVDISSSYIRQMVMQNRSIKYLLPEGVEEYIAKNNLYRE